VSDAAAIAAFEPQAGDWVVNCTAWTDVDGAETHEAQALAVNGDGVGALARRCTAARAKLVHYSTDYVFAGTASQPYPVDAPLAPINAYGRTKAAGERQIAESGCQHLIVRTSWLYAPWGRNFVRTIAQASSQREGLRVVDDQRGRPTSVQYLAATTAAVLSSGGGGIFHVTDGGECTWFEFAAAIAARVSPACRVEPCTTSEYPRPAKRPAYSVLDLSRTEALVGPMPPWQTNLQAVLDQL
jgi:dTDP-4-dehydrorhamnose reductase